MYFILLKTQVFLPQPVQMNIQIHFFHVIYVISVITFPLSYQQGAENTYTLLTAGGTT